jgi:hypothetical protein
LCFAHSANFTRLGVDTSNAGWSGSQKGHTRADRNALLAETWEPRL